MSGNRIGVWLRSLWARLFKIRKYVSGEQSQDDLPVFVDEDLVTNPEKIQGIYDNYCFYKLQHSKYNGPRRNAICMKLAGYDEKMCWANIVLNYHIAWMC